MDAELPTDAETRAEDGGQPVAPQPTRSKGAAPTRGSMRRQRKKGMSAVWLFLLFGAAPVGLLTWFFVQPESYRNHILDKVPEGVGGRALKAGICMGVLIVLARIALPAFHGTSGALRTGLGWMQTRPRWLRILLYPAEALLWLLWFIVQVLYAVDAVLILAAAAATLMLVVRILKPEFLPDFFPDLLG